MKVARVLLRAFILGCIASSLYVYLSGGYEKFFSVAWIAPLTVMIISFILWLETKITRPFWIALIYFSLPIILNGLSQLCGFFGFVTLQYFLFDIRYMILLYVLIVSLITIIIIIRLRGIKKRRKKEKWKKVEQKK